MFDNLPSRRNRREDFLSPFFDSFTDNEFFNALTNRGNFRADLKEDNDSYLVEADLPGIKKGDIDIEYNNNNLIIRAKRDESLEENKENYVRRERHYGEFTRSFYVDNIDEENIKAKFEDGVLKIRLAKLTKDNENSKKINID